MTPLRVAEAACRPIRDPKTHRECVFDVRIMGDPGVAKNSQTLQRINSESGAAKR
jgi:hypothetical protein